MTTRRTALLVVAAAVALALGSLAAVRRARRVELERFGERLLALEGEDPAGRAALHREFETDLAASLDETLAAMQVALDGFWLETEHTYESCGRVVRSYGGAGAAACLRALERDENVLAALECLDPASLAASELPRMRRLVARYVDRSGTVGADARAILGR